jgi:hypothetical protein
MTRIFLPNEGLVPSRTGRGVSSALGIVGRSRQSWNSSPTRPGFFFDCTEQLLEPFGLNARGGAIQALTFVVFLKLRTGEEWANVVAISGLFSAIHFVSLVSVGVSHQQLMVYQMPCMIASMLSVAAPLLTFFSHLHFQVYQSL